MDRLASIDRLVPIDKLVLVDGFVPIEGSAPVDEIVPIERLILVARLARVNGHDFAILRSCVLHIVAALARAAGGFRPLLRQQALDQLLGARARMLATVRHARHLPPLAAPTLPGFRLNSRPFKRSL